MKRQVQQTGIRKYFGADLVELQGEPLKVLDSLFSEYGPCVVQGCEPSAAEDGTYDIAPGLVALRTADPEGAERVMAMPFGGARGVSLPVWLVAEDTVQERVYGDGKVKPVAHSYSAVVTASEPAGGVSSLQITAQGAPRLVDVLQDAAHRFVSDADKAKWDARVSAAQLAEALAAKADVNGDASEVFRAKRLFLDDANVRGVSGGDHSGALDNNDVYLMNWDSAQGAVALLSKEDPYFMRLNEWVKRTIWHSGNFDPATKQDTTKNLADGYDLNTLHTTGTYDTINAVNAPVSGWIYVDVIQFSRGAGWVSQTVYTFGQDNTPNRIFQRNGLQTSDWTPWVEIYHSGNFDPADYLHYVGGIPDDNMDNAVAPGIYSYGNVTINRPTSYGTLLVLVSPLGPWIVQLAFGTENQHTYYRRRTNWAAWTPWRMFYDSGNLGPASASANGLMSAADKQKLDGMSGDLKRLGWGIIGSNGTTIGKSDSVIGAAHNGTGKYDIQHTIGHSRYIVQATVDTNGTQFGYASVSNRSGSWFTIRTADDSTLNDFSFAFQIFEY